MTDKERPFHTIRLGSLEAAIWRHETNGRPWFNYTTQRCYQVEVEGQATTWRSSDSFGMKDALLASKLHDLVHSWLCQQTEKGAVEESETVAHSKTMTTGTSAGCSSVGRSVSVSERNEP